MIITKKYLTRRSAVDGKLLIDFTWLKRYNINHNDAGIILKRLGFNWESTQVKLLDVARRCVGALYHRGSRLHDAPMQFDCSSFIRYCYAQVGLWIPRRSIQQFNCGALVQNELTIGDLLFSKGYIPYWDTPSGPHVGHVGLYIGDNRFVHAADKLSGVVVGNAKNFIQKNNYVGSVRFVPQLDNCVTLHIPPRWQDAESVDDIKWIIRINS